MKRLALMRQRNGEDGAVALEFALVSMMFFMILFGILAFGLLFGLNHTLSHAAAEGARSALAAAPGGEVAAAESAALTRLGWLGEGATVSATKEPCDSDPGHDCVRVVTTYDGVNSSLIPPVPGLDLVIPDVMSRHAVLQLTQVPTP